MAASQEIKIILFDLGGVLLKLRDPIETFGLQISEAEFKVQWLQSPSVRKFESGAIETEEFARSIVAEAELPYDWQEFISRFNSWPERIFDQTVGILQAIPASYRCALLSNINALHWGRHDISGPLAGCFDRLFLSYQIGVRKPHPDIYRHALNQLGTKGEQCFFIDDLPENVEAARAAGIHAYQFIPENHAAIQHAATEFLEWS